MSIKTGLVLLGLSIAQLNYSSGNCCRCNYDYESRHGGLQNYCNKEPLKPRQRLTLYDIETSKGLSR